MEGKESSGSWSGLHHVKLAEVGRILLEVGGKPLHLSIIIVLNIRESGAIMLKIFVCFFN